MLEKIDAMDCIVDDWRIVYFVHSLCIHCSEQVDQYRNEATCYRVYIHSLKFISICQSVSILYLEMVADNPRWVADNVRCNSTEFLQIFLNDHYCTRADQNIDQIRLLNLPSTMVEIPDSSEALRIDERPHFENTEFIKNFWNWMPPYRQHWLCVAADHKLSQRNNKSTDSRLDETMVVAQRFGGNVRRLWEIFWFQNTVWHDKYAMDFLFSKQWASD